jgi:hypothetical protein
MKNPLDITTVRLPLQFMRGEKGSGITMAVCPITCEYMMALASRKTYWVIQKSPTERPGSSLAYTFRVASRTYYAPTLQQAKQDIQAVIDHALRYEI